MIYDEIKLHLEKYPSARERRNKNRFIAWIIDTKYGGRMQTGSSVPIFEEIVGDVLQYDRYWRKVLQEEPKLRGSDYDDKKVLKQEKEIELGYESGFDEFKDIVDKF